MITAYPYAHWEWGRWMPMEPRTGLWLGEKSGRGCLWIFSNFFAGLSSLRELEEHHKLWAFFVMVRERIELTIIYLP